MKTKGRNKGGTTGSRRGCWAGLLGPPVTAERNESTEEWPELLHALWSGQIEQEQVVLVALFGQSERGQAYKAQSCPECWELHRDSSHSPASTNTNTLPVSSSQTWGDSLARLI